MIKKKCMKTFSSSTVMLFKVKHTLKKKLKRLCLSCSILKQESPRALLTKEQMKNSLSAKRNSPIKEFLMSCFVLSKCYFTNRHLQVSLKNVSKLTAKSKKKKINLISNRLKLVTRAVRKSSESIAGHCF